MKFLIFLSSCFLISSNLFAHQKISSLFGNEEEARGFIEELQKERSPENQEAYEFFIQLLHAENEHRDLELLAKRQAPLKEMISFAILYNKPEHLKKLLSFKRFDLNSQDEDGFTALHEAAFLLRKECVIALLNAGAKRDTLSHEGHTALSLVIEIENKLGYDENNPQGFLSKIYKEQKSFSLEGLLKIYDINFQNLDELKQLLRRPIKKDLKEESKEDEDEDEGEDEWIIIT